MAVGNSSHANDISNHHVPSKVIEEKVIDEQDRFEDNVDVSTGNNENDNGAVVDAKSNQNGVKSRNVDPKL